MGWQGAFRQPERGNEILDALAFEQPTHTKNPHLARAIDTQRVKIDAVWDNDRISPWCTLKQQISDKVAGADNAVHATCHPSPQGKQQPMQETESIRVEARYIRSVHGNDDGQLAKFRNEQCQQAVRKQKMYVHNIETLRSQELSQRRSHV